MPPPRRPRDADTSRQALHAALVARGHDVTRTPQAWMPREAPDAAPLLGATVQGQGLFPCHVRDVLALAQQDPQPGGVLLAAPRRWTLSPWMAALDRVLAATTAADWLGQGRWLHQWRS